MISIFTKPMDVMRKLRAVLEDSRLKWVVYDGTTPSTPQYPFLTMRLQDCPSAIPNRAGFGDGYKPIVEIGIVAFKDGEIYDLVDSLCETLMNLDVDGSLPKPKTLTVKTGIDTVDYIQFVVTISFCV